MGLFSFLKNKSRKELIEEKAEVIFYSVLEDLNNFSTEEQAKIVKCVNILFVKEFSKKYNKAYQDQQNILIAKELIK